MRIFVDLDGVLADFDTHFYNICRHYPSDLSKKEKWKVVEEQYKHGSFFAKLPVIDGAKDLMKFLKPYDPIIFTATGHSIQSAGWEKMKWVKKHISSKIPVICIEAGKDKAILADKDSLLIDDRAEAIVPWVAAGGYGILHTNAESTIAQLRALLRGI
ncbi:MAG: hypothetical protein DRH08_01850 [Deltaproteobacteria bacterium]|nr:MAG: hypothetical protein DRH08_01850 [Deltaproteobacteria bacterium]